MLCSDVLPIENTDWRISKAFFLISHLFHLQEFGVMVRVRWCLPSVPRLMSFGAITSFQRTHLFFPGLLVMQKGSYYIWGHRQQRRLLEAMGKPCSMSLKGSKPRWGTEESRDWPCLLLSWVRDHVVYEGLPGWTEDFLCWRRMGSLSCVQLLWCLLLAAGGNSAHGVGALSLCMGTLLWRCRDDGLQRLSLCQLQDTPQEGRWLPIPAQVSLCLSSLQYGHKV